VIFLSQQMQSFLYLATLAALFKSGSAVYTPPDYLYVSNTEGLSSNTGLTADQPVTPNQAATLIASIQSQVSNSSICTTVVTLCASDLFSGNEMQIMKLAGPLTNYQCYYDYFECTASTPFSLPLNNDVSNAQDPISASFQHTRVYGSVALPAGNTNRTLQVTFKLNKIPTGKNATKYTLMCYGTCLPASNYWLQSSALQIVHYQITSPTTLHFRYTDFNSNTDLVVPLEVLGIARSPGNGSYSYTSNIGDLDLVHTLTAYVTTPSPSTPATVKVCLDYFCTDTSTPFVTTGTQSAVTNTAASTSMYLGCLADDSICFPGTIFTAEIFNGVNKKPINTGTGYYNGGVPNGASAPVLFYGNRPTDSYQVQQTPYLPSGDSSRTINVFFSLPSETPVANFSNPTYYYVSRNYTGVGTQYYSSVDVDMALTFNSSSPSSFTKYTLLSYGTSASGTASGVQILRNASNFVLRFYTSGSDMDYVLPTATPLFGAKRYLLRIEYTSALDATTLLNTTNSTGFARFFLNGIHLGASNSIAGMVPNPGVYGKIYTAVSNSLILNADVNYQNLLRGTIHYAEIYNSSSIVDVVTSKLVWTYSTQSMISSIIGVPSNISELPQGNSARALEASFMLTASLASNIFYTLLSYGTWGTVGLHSGLQIFTTNGISTSFRLSGYSTADCTITVSNLLLSVNRVYNLKASYTPGNPAGIAKFYLDGVFIGSSSPVSNTLSTTGTNLFIGCAPWNSGTSTNQCISSVGVLFFVKVFKSDGFQRGSQIALNLAGTSQYLKKRTRSGTAAKALTCQAASQQNIPFFAVDPYAQPSKNWGDSAVNLKEGSEPGCLKANTLTTQSIINNLTPAPASYRGSNPVSDKFIGFSMEPGYTPYMFNFDNANMLNLIKNLVLASKRQIMYRIGGTGTMDANSIFSPTYFLDGTTPSITAIQGSLTRFLANMDAISLNPNLPSPFSTNPTMYWLYGYLNFLKIRLENFATNIPAGSAPSNPIQVAFTIPYNYDFWNNCGSTCTVAGTTSVLYKNGVQDTTKYYPTGVQLISNVARFLGPHLFSFELGNEMDTAGKGTWQDAACSAGGYGDLNLWSSTMTCKKTANLVTLDTSRTYMNTFYAKAVTDLTTALNAAITAGLSNNVGFEVTFTDNWPIYLNRYEWHPSKTIQDTVPNPPNIPGHNWVTNGELGFLNPSSTLNPKIFDTGFGSKTRSIAFHFYQFSRTAGAADGTVDTDFSFQFNKRSSSDLLSNISVSAITQCYLDGQLGGACLTGKNCSASLSCYQTICRVMNVASGGSCDSLHLCGPGLTCSSSKICATSPPSPPPPPPPSAGTLGGSCTSNSSCIVGFECSKATCNCISSICVMVNLGQTRTCDSLHQCRSDYDCVAGTCKRLVDDGPYFVAGLMEVDNYMPSPTNIDQQGIALFLNNHKVLSTLAKVPSLVHSRKPYGNGNNEHFRLGEVGTCIGGGCPSSTELFAGALWILQLMLDAAVYNLDGANFHHAAYYYPGANWDAHTQNNYYSAHSKYNVILYGNNIGFVTPAIRSEPGNEAAYPHDPRNITNTDYVIASPQYYGMLAFANAIGPGGAPASLTDTVGSRIVQAFKFNFQSGDVDSLNGQTSSYLVVYTINHNHAGGTWTATNPDKFFTVVVISKNYGTFNTAWTSRVQGYSNPRAFAIQTPVGDSSNYYSCMVVRKLTPDITNSDGTLIGMNGVQAKWNQISWNGLKLLSGTTRGGNSNLDTTFTTAPTSKCYAAGNTLAPYPGWFPLQINPAEALVIQFWTNANVITSQSGAYSSPPTSGSTDESSYVYASVAGALVLLLIIIGAVFATKANKRVPTNIGKIINLNTEVSTDFRKKLIKSSESDSPSSSPA